MTTTLPAPTIEAPAPVPAPLLAVSRLHVVVDDRVLVDDASFEVAAGEVVGLVGPNGAGKSTILRAVTGVLPSSGSVEVLDRPLASIAQRELFQRLAVVQQLPAAPLGMSVEELTSLGRHPHLGAWSSETPRDREAVESALERAGVTWLRDRTLGTLSGGERRRAFIARALAQEPRLLLLDEPTANLDATAQAEVLTLLRTLAADGVGVLVVLHDLTFAGAYCDRLVLLDDGRIVAAGHPSEVITSEQVAAVYGPGVRVVVDPESGLPLVVPALRSLS